MDASEIAQLCDSLSLSEKDGPITNLDSNLRRMGPEKLALSLVGKVISNKAVNREDFRSHWGLLRKVFENTDLLDVSKSLRCCTQVDLDGLGKASTMLLRYERIPEFCFQCEHIGHATRECIHVDQSLLPGSQKIEYGSWLRATSLTRLRRASFHSSMERPKEGVESEDLTSDSPDTPLSPKEAEVELSEPTTVSSVENNPKNYVNEVNFKHPEKSEVDVVNAEEVITVVTEGKDGESAKFASHNNKILKDLVGIEALKLKYDKHKSTDNKISISIAKLDNREKDIMVDRHGCVSEDTLTDYGPQKAPKRMSWKRVAPEAKNKANLIRIPSDWRRLQEVESDLNKLIKMGELY
ncbi:hypothetical protein JRO89_XS11G0128800 [Xanthoceras sorbifolium]|uniref:CCHC-type domain-containing protein n=1 Tax=Xanthoceras sorbifolium TaxID=99658 RepID=A0ABQ8HFI4_9ROSI|nr:hypothetical protein JRO89_XS11G0128800 [Xanthoceras sorbifolium]